MRSSPSGKKGKENAVSEDNRSLTNSVSQNYDDDEFETISKSHISQSKGKSLVDASKTDGSYSMNFDESASINITSKMLKSNQRSAENPGKAGHKKTSSKTMKRVDIETSTTKPIKEVKNENS